MYGNEPLIFMADLVRWNVTMLAIAAKLITREIKKGVAQCLVTLR